MHVIIAGASGYVGTELSHQLAAAGHTVTRLVRRAAQGPSESQWAPARGEIAADVMTGVDAVVNLSGASLSRLPWTPRYKREILRSRLDATNTLARAISSAATPPSVFLSGSAVGFYGNRPGQDLTEESERGEGLLPGIVEQWEAAARVVPSATRLVLLRTGIVVGRGGAFAPLELLTRFGLGARLGNGRAHWPWVSLHDEAAAIVHLLTSKLSGPVNLVGPTPASSDAITKRLALAMRRPRVFAIPRGLLELGLGDAARGLMLSDQRVIPAKLLEDHFRFRDETIEKAISSVWSARA